MFLQLLTALSLLKVGLAAFCDQTFTTSSGTVSSPSFYTSSSYANNQNCEYDIQVSSGSGIKLSWQTFDIKGKMPNCYDDYVEIYIGCARRSIGKYCSENGGYKPFDVYSPDSCLRIKFHSDSSGSGTGFQAYYSSFSLSFGRSGIGAECSSYYKSYPKTLSSTSGIISSPWWPRNYPTLRDCYWRIDVDVGKNVKIAIMDFDLERYSGCDHDKVKIKGGRSGDSYDRSDTIKDSMCGEKYQFYFTSSDRRIWIRFKSNSYKTDRGFVAGYVMYDSTETRSGGSVTTAGIVVGIIIPLVIVACVCYACVYRRRQARRAQQQGTVAHVTVPPQEMTVQHPPPPPQPGYVPPPQQGYAPPPQPGYVPPPQQGYGPPQQPGYALPPQPPPPYSQVAGTPYPQQGKSGPYPAAPPGGAPPYPPGQPDGVPPYPIGQPGAAPPYPPGQPGAVPPYPPGQPGGVPPYPPEQPPGGVAPYPSAPSTATAPPYPTQ